MNCPVCGSLEARVQRTLFAPDVDRRQRRCRCGVTWNTTERIDAKSIHVPDEGGKVKGEMQTAQHVRERHALNCAADNSGSLSLPDISNQSLSSSDLSSKASNDRRNARVGRKGRPSTVEYSPAFELIWAGMEHKRGNKQPAFDAWVKIDPAISPSPELVISRWNRWTETTQWQDGYGPHVATWLNQRGWENEPDEVEFRQRGRNKTDETMGHLKDFLKRGVG